MTTSASSATFSLGDTLHPLQVLYEFDGPRIFTLKSAAQDLLLAYQCGADESGDSFLLVPCDEQLIADLQSGRKAVREALAQPWSWTVDVSTDGRVRSTTRVDVRNLPERLLPDPGVMLLPSLQPLIAVRMVGVGLKEGAVPTSVIRRALDAVSGAMKALLETVHDLPRVGRPFEFLRRYYDLPPTRFAYASFEVAFSHPRGQPEFETLEAQAFAQVGTLLRDGLKWATSCGDKSESPCDDPGKGLQVLAALEKLAPPQQGQVTEVHVSGTLASPFGEKQILTRDSSVRIRQALRHLRRREQIVTLTGVVREFDKDKLTFILREIEGDKPDAKFTLDDQLFDDVFDAFKYEHVRVRAVGRQFPNSDSLELVAVNAIEDDAAGKDDADDE